MHRLKQADNNLLADLPVSNVQPTAIIHTPLSIKTINCFCQFR